MQKIKLQAVDLGFLGEIDRLSQVVHRRLVQDDLVVLCPEAFRDETRIFVLVPRLVESQREGLERSGVTFPDHRHEAAGVYATRQGYADGDI